LLRFTASHDNHQPLANFFRSMQHTVRHASNVSGHLRGGFGVVETSENPTLKLMILFFL
jgi:hypothetical protein